MKRFWPDRFVNNHKIVPYMTTQAEKERAGILEWHRGKARFEKAQEIREKETGFRSSLLSGLVYLSRYFTGHKSLHTSVHSQ